VRLTHSITFDVARQNGKEQKVERRRRQKKMKA
jgi:hypothetical protein